MTTRIGLALVAFAFALATVAMPAGADHVRQLTNTETQEWVPVIKDNLVAWQTREYKEIGLPGNLVRNDQAYLHNLATGEQSRISDFVGATVTHPVGFTQDYLVAAHRNVYRGDKPSGTYIYDLTFGDWILLREVPGNLAHGSTVLADNWFAWISETAIYKHNLLNGQNELVYEHPQDIRCVEPQSRCEPCDDACIDLQNNEPGTCLNRFRMRDLAGDEELMVWTHTDICHDGESYEVDIHGFQLDSGQHMVATDSEGIQTYPDASGGLVVWMDERDGNPDIYLRGGDGSEIAVATNLLKDNQARRPFISGNNIVWSEWRYETSDIFLYHVAAGTESRMTNSAPNWSSLGDIDGSRVAYLSGPAGTNREVYVLEVGSPPIAAAGDDQVIITTGSTVHLDGSESYDLDGDPFTYAWTLSGPTGSAAALDDPSSATPSFVPDVYGDYLATLVVTDSRGLTSVPDDVAVSFENVPPVADAMAYPQAVRVGDVVLLDASGSSDANGDMLSYEWSLVMAPGGSAAALVDPTAQMTTFTPDLAGTYQVDLIVSDGLADSEIASVTVVATTAEGDLVDALEQATDVVNLDPSVFKNKSLQKNMAKHIGQALAHVDKGEFNSARDKLEAVLRETDGCATGGSPDPNDWIVDCAAQSQVQTLITQALALIDEILGS